MHNIKKDFKYREIPYNYTSFSDKEIVAEYLGDEAWDILCELRGHRVTGRSAKLLFEVIGDIFAIYRNPYIYNDFLDNRSKRSRLKKLHNLRFSVVEKAANNDLVYKILEKTREADISFFESFGYTKKLRKKIRSALKGITASRNIRFTAFHRAAHITDATDWRVACPEVVVYPDSETELAGLIEVARDLGLKVIARGGGTGLTGGAVPVYRNTMVINTEKLRVIDGIREYEVAGKKIPVIRLGAGVVTESAMDYARNNGYIFATDPTSSWASTIGGNIAENCGGKKAVMWGTAIDNIYSFKIINAYGEILKVQRVNHPYRKIEYADEVEFAVYKVSAGNEKLLKSIRLTGDDIRKEGVGKDITNKALGGVPGLQKEGGDGIIFEAEFVLYKPFANCRTICLEFFGEDLVNASKAIIDIRNSFESDEAAFLTALEHFDEKYEEAINYRNKSDRQELPKAVLLIDAESNDESVLDAICYEVIEMVRQYNVEGFVAVAESERELFWKDRKNLGAIARHTNAFKLNEDVVIPIESLPLFADFTDMLNLQKEMKNSLSVIDELYGYLATRNISDDKFFNGKKISYTMDLERIKTLLSEKLTTIDGLIDMAINGFYDEYLQQKDKFNQIRNEGVVGEIQRQLIEEYRNHFKGYSDVIAEIDELVADTLKRKIIIATHMHAGDGNIHVNIPVLSSDYPMMQEADDTAGVVMQITTVLGGVISGEHGIGLTKIKFIAPEILDDFAEYKREADPEDLFNPGKLCRDFPVHKIYTPSLNLIEMEAFILKSSDLETLTSEISGCIRCGKCKPVCNTNYPDATMFFSPRNKILALSMIEEAVLYEAQTETRMSLRNFSMMRNIAYHCTGCHQCFTPCPVDIDFGEVTQKINRLLVDRNRNKFNAMTWFTLFYLRQRGYYVNKVFRLGLLKMGFSMQRLAFKINRPVKHITDAVAPKMASLFDGCFPKSGEQTTRDIFSMKRERRIYSFHNPEKEIISSVLYFPGCGSERMYPQISLATIALLNHFGVRVVIPPEYLCCGYTLLSNGRVAAAERVSHENQVVFHRMADTISYMEIKDVVVSCGTCHEMLDTYQINNIFEYAAVIDISAFLINNHLLNGNVIADETLYYHEPCHSPLKEHDVEGTFSGIFGKQPLQIPNCCGEAGTLAISRPDISKNLRSRKKTNICQSCGGSNLDIITSCPNCVQGLTKIQGDISINGKHLSIYLAEKIIGSDWREQFIKRVKDQEGLERILY